jgi:hypothetical protein
MTYDFQQHHCDNCYYEDYEMNTLPCSGCKIDEETGELDGWKPVDWNMEDHS